MATMFINSGDPDHMLHSAASVLGLHCLPITLWLGGVGGWWGGLMVWMS